METDMSTDVVKITGDLARRFGLEEGREFIRKVCSAELVKQAVREGERAVISVISTGGVDRDGDILRPDGLDDRAYRRHPIVLFGHRYNELPIGRNEWIKVEGRQVIAKTVYVPGDINPLAERVFQFRKQGFPLAQSIGFVATDAVWAGEDGFDAEFDQAAGKGWVKAEEKDRVRRIIRKWTLYEYSDVVVPANPEALTLAVSKGLISRAEADSFEAGDKGGPTESTGRDGEAETGPAWKYLVERIARLEAERDALRNENQGLRQKTSGEAGVLSGVERILPILIKAYQDQVGETSRDLLEALGRITGVVTLPDRKRIFE